MNVKKAFGIFAVLLLLCPSLVFSQAKAKVKYRLNVGMVVTETDPMFKGAQEFKKNVEARTKGEIAIGILGAPYIVDSAEEAKKLTTSSLFKGWTDELADKYDYRVLSFNWYQGARHFWTNKPIKVPADLKGLRIRTPGATVWQATIKAMGAEPTSLGWAEVYPGIQQKVIDGAEAQHPASSGIRMYEVCKYLAKTYHFQLVTPLVCSESWFQTLPKDYQDILLEEALKAGDYATKLTIDGLDANEAEFKSKGVIISEPDLTPFKKACEAVYDQIPGYRDLKNQVNKLLGK